MPGLKTYENIKINNIEWRISCQASLLIFFTKDFICAITAILKYMSEMVTNGKQHNETACLVRTKRVEGRNANKVDCIQSLDLVTMLLLYNTK